MPEVVRVKRDGTDVPFGFKIQGGSDFSVPLSILQVTPNSVADLCGLRPGDHITKINDVETSWMDHSRAKQEIIRAGNEFYLTVERNAVDINKPTQLTPLNQLKTNAPVNPSQLGPPPPARKTDLTVDKSDSIKIGSSHNRAPMPFNSAVGTTMDYKASKPENWQAGDYTKWTGDPQQQPQQQQQQQQQYQPGPAKNPAPTVTAVFHSQYNSPISLYSDSNVFQEFQNQTKGLMPDVTAHSQPMSPPAQTPNFHNQPKRQPSESNSATFHHNPQALVENLMPSSAPRGCNSLSMGMLNLGIQDAASTNSAPPSIFDLKRGHNPTGASVPRGFRSVQAPGPLPPEQRHAPTRTEYQVKHVKQNWIEPKIN